MVYTGVTLSQLEFEALCTLSVGLGLSFSETLRRVLDTFFLEQSSSRRHGDKLRRLALPAPE